VGRRHLIRLTGACTLGLATAAAAPAAAVRSVPWQPLARGAATADSGARPVGFLAASKTAARTLVVRVPPAAARMVLRLDYRSSVAVGVFGRFGCHDGRVSITGIERVGPRLRVRLVLRPLKPGAVECQAIFSTFRLVRLERQDLGRPLPSHVGVTLARA
jgi:hypothetical protein